MLGEFPILAANAEEMLCRHLPNVGMIPGYLADSMCVKYTYHVNNVRSKRMVFLEIV